MFAGRLEVKGCVSAGPQPGFKLPEAAYDTFVLLGVEAGSFEFEIGGRRGSAAFGDLVLCPPDTVFKRWTDGEIAFLMVRFDWDREQIRDMPRPVGKITVRDTARLSSTYTYLRKLQEKHGHMSSVAHLAGHLLADLLFLCEMEKQFAYEDKSAVDPLMQLAAGHIHRNLFGEISMKRLAEQLGIGQPQLTRRFRAAYGQTPVDYVNRLRLEEVKRLLLETDDTLEAIAYRCGYENRSYMSRLFTARIGLSPSAFRHHYRM